MQIGKLFDLLTDVDDLLSYFENVDDKQQLVSRLDVLRRKGTDELLETLDGLRASKTDLLHETLEMNASLDDDDDPEEKSDNAELDKLLADVDGANEPPDEPPAEGSDALETAAENTNPDSQNKPS